MGMDKIKMALGLDGAADAGEVLLAVENLCAEHACEQFLLERAREEVLAAREATADVFVEVLAELGFMDAEALEAARDAYVANPDVAAVALLGSADIVAAANPYGCNQYGHRKGHNGGSNDDLDSEVDDFEKRYNSTPKNERWKLDKERKELEEKWRKRRDNPTPHARKKKPEPKAPVTSDASDDLDREIDDFEKEYNSTPKNERWKLDSKRKELEEKWRKRRDGVQATNTDGCNQYGHRNGHQGKPIVLKKGGSSDGSGKKLWNLIHKKSAAPGYYDGKEHEADPEKYSGPEWKAWRKRSIED